MRLVEMVLVYIQHTPKLVKINQHALLKDSSQQGVENVNHKVAKMTLAFLLKDMRCVLVPNAFLNNQAQGYITVVQTFQDKAVNVAVKMRL